MTSFVRTRNEKTEQAYLKSSLIFEAYTSKALGTPDVTCVDVAKMAISKKSTWSSSTWRQRKAALIFRFNMMGTMDSNEAKSMLLQETQAGTLKKSNRTSAQRLKNSKSEDFDKVLSEISTSRSRYAESLYLWLKLGFLVGLRPHEWSNAEVIWLTESIDNNVSNPQTTIERIPYLRVLNGKNSNFRSHGLYRHICLINFDKNSINTIIEFSIRMTSIENSGEYDTFYNSCKKLLFRTNKKLKLQNKKHIQIYSSRHKFASNIKTLYTKQQVAALMGHANDVTADGHYGRKHSGGGSVDLRPLKQEVERVRLKNQSNQKMPTNTSLSKEVLVERAKSFIGK